ncbi:RagB/SusD family nutrient uptake outer membrane protein [Olivibacter sp. XZL3]|uniref:RagB/SusD family nutrient uptake outer membrane protein n=1 Tax=Olivibacter sp. XZL3 TaxID=1735116 RepID=UPI001065624B|nr:RagB/SusD family nutrient uptake outer membrane protein [Olivibacter sp. XZL3]
MKRLHKTLICALLFFGTSCSKFLDRESQAILTDDQIYSDLNMVNSLLANFYGRIMWGQNITDSYSYTLLDEAGVSSGGPNNLQNYDDAQWRVYDYTLIRNLNQFLAGIRSEQAASFDPNTRNTLEGEARFIRAWTYFNMCRSLGGMPIVGDEVFEYQSGTDVTTMQFPRSTEAGLYDYIIEECTQIATMLPDDPGTNTNAARANKWAALTLKARAALYAASIAKYNYKTPDVRTAGNEVGIPAERASEYYQIAYDAAQEIIVGGRYRLHDANADKGRNFYEAICEKGSPEVIWAKDYIYPGQTHGFTNNNIASSVRGDIDANIMTPILNLVEAFEYVNDRNGTLKTTNASGEYIYYDNPEDLFKDKDPRLYGTVIYSGADFRGMTITYQAGVKYLENGRWETITASPGASNAAYGGVITSIDGPTTNSDQYVNKTGFNVRKFIDENRDASTRGRGSDMWFVRMRYAEVLMIAAEAALELGRPQSEVAGYINQIRGRAGIQELTQISLQDIIQERRVEFAFEDHRWWDLKRLRVAHEIWNGDANNYAATHYALFPYRIYAPGNPNHGKWVFDKQRASHSLYPRNFRYQNYYSFIDQGWINSNPKMVRNPYQ